MIYYTRGLIEFSRSFDFGIFFLWRNVERYQFEILCAFTCTICIRMKKFPKFNPSFFTKKNQYEQFFWFWVILKIFSWWQNASRYQFKIWCACTCTICLRNKKLTKFDPLVLQKFLIFLLHDRMLEVFWLEFLFFMVKGDGIWISNLVCI